jgi:hypothetical protein
VVEATVGHRDKHGKERVGKQLWSVGRAVVYLAIGVSAAMMATGSSNGGDEKSATAKLMAAPFGRVLVAAVGLVILAIGARHLYKAATAKFTDDLTSGVGPGTVALVASATPPRVSRSASSAPCSAGPRSPMTRARPAASTPRYACCGTSPTAGHSSP